MEKLDVVNERISDFRKIVKELVANACHGALLGRGFVVDESLEQTGRRRDKGPKSSYIEQAKKDKFCFRLTS